MSEPALSSFFLPSGAPSESLLRLIADSVPAMMAYFDLPEMRCRFANQSYADYIGRAVPAILGETVREAIGERAWQEVLPYITQCQRGERVKYVREHRRSGQPLSMVEVNLIPHLQSDGTMVGAFVLITDITEHWHAEQAVRQSEERMRKFAAATEEAIVFHRNGIVIDGNDALLRMVGYTLEEVRGTSIFDFIAPEWRAVSLEYTRQAREDLYEIVITHKDGHTIPVEVMGKTMPLPEADYRVAVLRDITARRQAQEREAFIALHDPLTQLPNRRYLVEQLEQRIALASQENAHLALLFIDLDHFKTINDSLGHHAGDQMLVELSTRLQLGVCESALVARLGGDEFVVVLPAIANSAQALHLAEQLLNTMQAPVNVADQLLSISPSIGISLFPEHGNQSEDLLRGAEAAMYHAKEQGRANCQLYQIDMSARASEVLQQERQLREAIASNAFVLHYQPQINAHDGSLQGFEALVRWQHPERGLLGPNEFIHFAESRGLITPIGRWVLHEACRQLKAWQDEGLQPGSIAVNLSAIEFHQRDLVNEIANSLKKTSLQPQCLEIELTESVLMQPNGPTLNTLNAIRALGVGVSVDDFGTGYSSLAYLTRYPIEKLKIDRSFVMDTPEDSDSVAIVTAIIQMGRSLQLEVVAEGVETSAQLTLLQQLGCNLVQGYLVAKPMDAEATRRWLRMR